MQWPAKHRHHRNHPHRRHDSHCYHHRHHGCRSIGMGSISINFQDGAGSAGQDHQDVAPLRLLPPSQRGTSSIITKLTSLWHS